MPFRYKKQLKTTAYFAFQNIPFVGTIAMIPDYIYSLKNPKIDYIIKNRYIMDKHIAINWLEPNGKKLKIPSGEIYVREDWWKDKNKRLILEVHEKVEIYLQTVFELSFKQSHSIALKAQHDVIENRNINIENVKIH